MAAFTISLPNNLMGTVRKGKITKIAFRVADLLKFKKRKIEVRVGYIIHVDLAPGDRIVYQLSKTKEGKWVSEPEDPMTQAVRRAIDRYEIYQSDEMPNRF
jgi:ASC-1-like (ASCH) protein